MTLVQSRPYFDIVVVVPLEEELLEFIEIFPLDEDLSTSTLFRSSVVSGVDGLSILVAKQEDMGRTHAQNALLSGLRDFDAGLAVCLGIAGCLTDDLRLGDVCYSSRVFDVLDNAKASDLDGGRINLEFSPTHYATDRTLVAALSFVRIKSDLKSLYLGWQEARAEYVKALVPAPIIGRNGREETLGPPRTKDGAIACALVTKSDEYNAKLKQIDRKVLAVETESGGIYEKASVAAVPVITIRGISDHADDAKNKLESGTAGAIRKVAASNATSFLEMQLRNPLFSGFLRERRQTSTVSGAASRRLVPSKRTLTDVVRDTSVAIDEKLRELSPEFRLQPKGYRLPVPRVRHLEYDSVLGEAARGAPTDLAEAFETRQSILLTLPRTYPDYSLPWVIADHLLATELSGRKVIPVVIDGALLAPPRAGLRHLASSQTDDIEPGDGVQVVYIVDNIPTSSKSKLNFLKRELEAVAEAKFIFITREDSHLVDTTEFAAERGADTFEICAISFREIAHFIEKNFSMTGSEAEVVALRLRETFDQFDLSAHPTYFAGIPKETLSALLQANRRAELIQLAVDGFLTFIVADDKADVTLSRTTRSRFLRQLAIKLNVEKVSFTQAQLINLVQEFSRKYDFAIDPLHFIRSFTDKGILHFGSDDYVAFSLPFIESYLLASELGRMPEVAITYFEFENEKFDVAAFDLYSEIGASDELIEKYTLRLQEQIGSFGIPDGEKHILLTEKIHPTMLASQEKLQSIRHRLKLAVDHVQSNKGDVKAKQRMIDVAEYVRESAAKETQRERIQVGSNAPSSDILSRLDDAVQTWIIGVILLGSGAEHLTANVKQDLSKRLVTLASSIVHYWTEVRSTIDFAEIKKQLTRDEVVSKFTELNGSGKGSFEETRSLILSFVDAAEYYMLAEPFRRVTNHLCEEARHRVLAASVEKASFDDPLEQILHGAWLTDIESRRGKDALKEAIRKLPRSPFLRTNLATHFLTRVHWSHWRKEDRLVLLDAAEEAIKPLAISFNKGELKRIIERDTPETARDDPDS